MVRVAEDGFFPRRPLFEPQVVEAIERDEDDEDLDDESDSPRYDNQ